MHDMLIYFAHMWATCTEGIDKPQLYGRGMCSNVSMYMLVICTHGMCLHVLCLFGLQCIYELYIMNMYIVYR